MLVRDVWERFQSDWRQFCWMVVWTFLTAVPLALLWVWLMYVLYYAPLMSRLGAGAAFSLRLAFSSAGTWGLLGATVVMFGILQAVAMALVVMYRRDGVPFADTPPIPRWLSVLLPGSIWAAMNIADGWLFAHPLRTPFAVITGGLILYLGIYPTYLVLADGIGGLTAIRRSVALLAADRREAVRAAVILWVTSVVVVWLGVLTNAIPTIIDDGVVFIVEMVFSAFLLYYFTERFERKLRPALHP